MNNNNDKNKNKERHKNKKKFSAPSEAAVDVSSTRELEDLTIEDGGVRVEALGFG